MSANLDALIEYAIKGSELQRGNGRRWTEEEDLFLEQSLGYLTEEEIGRALGRSVTAVHIRWERDLNLPSPSKAPDVFTGETIAKMLGLDDHKITHWIDEGFIPGRVMAGGRKIRLVKRQDFMNWVMRPQSWMYIKIDRVKDAELKKQLERAMKQWGDEWWPTNKVARYHGIDTKDVQRHINLGRIKATQTKYSYGGRHPTRKWSYWFVLKSEATKIDLSQFSGTRPNWKRRKANRK